MTYWTFPLIKHIDLRTDTLISGFQFQTLNWLPSSLPPHSFPLLHQIWASSCGLTLFKWHFSPPSQPFSFLLVALDDKTTLLLKFLCNLLCSDTIFHPIVPWLVFLPPLPPFVITHVSAPMPTPTLNYTLKLTLWPGWPFWNIIRSCFYNYLKPSVAPVTYRRNSELFKWCTRPFKLWDSLPWPHSWILQPFLLAPRYLTTVCSSFIMHCCRDLSTCGPRILNVQLPRSGVYSLLICEFLRLAHFLGHSMPI